MCHPTGWYSAPQSIWGLDKEPMWFGKFLTRARESTFPPLTPLPFFLPLSLLSRMSQAGLELTMYLRMALNFGSSDLHLPNVESVVVPRHALRFMLCRDWTQHARHHWALSPVWAFPSSLPCSFTGSHVTQPDLELTTWSRMTLDVWAFCFHLRRSRIAGIHHHNQFRVSPFLKQIFRLCLC